MDQQSITSSWAFTCRSVQAASSSASRRCGDNDFAALIMEMVSEFCMKSVPFSGTELTERTKESTYLIGVIGAICDASQLAAKRPEQAGQIYTATEEFSAKVHMHGYNSRSADQLAEDIASIVAA